MSESVNEVQGARSTVRIGSERMTFMNFSPLLPLDYKPKLPSDPSLGIGLIGAGQIVNQAHLPAYRKAGFRVLAIPDQQSSAADETARRFEFPRFCDCVEELVGVPD